MSGQSNLFLPICAAVAILLSGCAGIQTEKTGDDQRFAIRDLSAGLPTAGLWRQHLLLQDHDGDGRLDIITPSPRKAQVGQKRPFVFLQDPGGSSWREGRIVFPDNTGYDYGGISSADLNRDGYADIVIANHTGPIMLFEGTAGGNFRQVPLPAPKDFASRAVVISDMDGDGWPDIVAFSEFSPADLRLERDEHRQRVKQQQGIVIFRNKKGASWEYEIVRGSDGLFGDSVAVGEIDGDGVRDIVIGNAVAVKGYINKVLWLGDGHLGYKTPPQKVFNDAVVSTVMAADIDGDGRDEVVAIISGVERDSTVSVGAFKWIDGEMRSVSDGLEAIEAPQVFDAVDVDGDGAAELVVLSSGRLSLWKYSVATWVPLLSVSLPRVETDGAFDVKAAREKDGSWLIVYNLGREVPEDLNKGIRAYRMTLR